MANRVSIDVSLLNHSCSSLFDANCGVDDLLLSTPFDAHYAAEY
jgi:hypothetical protein